MIETSDIKSLIGLVAARINEILRQKDYVVIGFPGGRSIQSVLKAMVEHKFNWKKIHIFMVDERLVPISDENSNFRLISQNLLKDLEIPQENIHPFMMREKPDYGVSEYKKEFMRYGGKFDIAFFGVGEDGHIGGLFPDMTIKRNEEDFIVFHDSPKPPKDRMSLSRKNVLRSDTIVLLFVGEEKSDAYRMFMNKKTTAEKCPAKLAYEVNSIIFVSL